MAADGPGAAGLDDRQRAFLRYAEKLTRSVREMGEADIRGLRDAGLGDADILHVAQVTAYFNYVNRMAEGLGVQLEPWFDPDADERGAAPEA